MHLDFSKLPIRNYFLVFDLLLLLHRNHLVRKILETYTAITVFVKPIEKMHDIPIQSVDAMKP
jgi:hypothetical protein